MRKFIYSNGEIDLSGKQLTDNEENHWFSDRFFTKYSFPVELELTDELNLALGNVADHNASEVNAYIEGYYVRMGEEHRAVLLLDRVSQVCSFTIRYGFEELPNWNKKLAELPLEQLDLGQQSIRAHATARLDLGYPAVNYNFPQIHINSLDIESEQWQYFEERLNARNAGQFLENEYDSSADEQINRTIMQPLPHLHHILKQGFLDAGYSVSGDFFNDSAFAKAYLFYFSEYYRSFPGESQEMVSRRGDHNGTRYVNPNNGRQTQDYNFVINTQPLPPGVYIVSGTIDSFGDEDYARLQLGNTVIERYFGFFGYALRQHFVDTIVRVLPGGSNVLTCFAAQANYIDVSGSIEYNSIWLDLTVAQIAKYDSNGDLVSTLIDATDINLKKCVPDVTFGELMTSLKQVIGLDVVPNGDTYRLDLIKNQINANDVIDLSGYEVRFPQREFKEGDVYSLEYKEQNSDDYTNQSIKIDRTGAQNILTSIEDNEVVSSEINLVPLPLKLSGGVQTATQVGDDTDTIYICKYDGLQAGDNNCIETGLNLTDLYDEYLDDLYQHLINGQPYQWSFIATELVVKKIKTRSRIFAYNKIFIVEKIQATDLGHDSVQVQLDLIAVL